MFFATGPQTEINLLLSFFQFPLHFVFFATGPQTEIDLLQLIGIPLDESVRFVSGFDGYPAFEISETAEINRLSSM